jgi:hypothetical protein
VGQRTLTLYWLEPWGKRSFWATLSPGQQFSSKSEATEAWVITDAAGTCVMVIDETEQQPTYLVS